MIGKLYYKSGLYLIPMEKSEDGYYQGFKCGKEEGIWSYDYCVHEDDKPQEIDMESENFKFTIPHSFCQRLIKQILNKNVSGKF